MSFSYLETALMPIDCHLTQISIDCLAVPTAQQVNLIALHLPFETSHEHSEIKDAFDRNHIGVIAHHDFSLLSAILLAQSMHHCSTSRHHTGASCSLAW
jgi:hypothetical protein